MKTRLTALLLLVLMLVGCTAAPSSDTPTTPDSTPVTATPETTTPETTTPEAGAQKPAQTTDGKLTREEAIAIALDTASLTENDVLRIWAEYELDDGVPEFEVEFRTADTEYDYTIHAETGAILSWDQEAEHAAQMTDPNLPADAPLTETDAISIALSHANLNEADVGVLHVEYDREDDDFEVEFYYNKLEYTYEIDAKTGTIRDHEVDD